MNNPSNVMWAQLILDNQATISDVPAQLQTGVGEVVDYFTKNAQPAESKPTTEPTTAPASTATTVATTDTATAPAQQDAEGQQ